MLLPSEVWGPVVSPGKQAAKAGSPCPPAGGQLLLLRRQRRRQLLFPLPGVVQQVCRHVVGAQLHAWQPGMQMKAQVCPGPSPAGGQ